MTSTATCRWCGAPLADGERLPGLIRCRACGVGTTDPWPSDAQLDAAYAGPYRPAAGRFSWFGDALLRRSRGSLAARLDRVAPRGPVLDVGSGEGALVSALRRRGRAATGIEREPGGAGGDPLAGADPGWAAIVFWHSLEHLPEPAAALRRASELLDPGGLLVVAAPNAESLQARAFGGRWLALDPPRHLVHLTGRAVRESLQQLGLRLERVSYLRGGQVVFGWLHGLVGSLPGHPDLYDAIRRPPARFHEVSRGGRLAAVAAGVLLLPAALVCAAFEVAVRRGGTFYVEARAARR
ncbi:MAG: class I SAM-dependent methyltransferase [Syntrophothermus sp.]